MLAWRQWWLSFMGMVLAVSYTSQIYQLVVALVLPASGSADSEVVGLRHLWKWIGTGMVNGVAV